MLPEICGGDDADAKNCEEIRLKRLMIMGAAIEQVPGIRKAKEMGYETAVIDYNANAVGIPLADKFYHVSTIDPEGVLDAARDFHADGFLTLATDLPMRAVAYASEKMGLPGITRHTALLATDKGEMIKALKAHGVETPWFQVADSPEKLKNIGKEVSYPCIMKPTDNAASRGVALVHNYVELMDKYGYSRGQSRSGQVIIEEYMRGPEVSVEMLSWKGEAHVLQITDKITCGPPHFVEVGHNQPSGLNQETKARIRDIAGRAVKALGITAGPAHVELIVTEEGPKIVELGARLGGDCITSHLVWLSTGIDMVKETIKVLCGEEPNLTKLYEKGASVRFLTSKKYGVLDHVDGMEAARAVDGVIEVSQIMKPGDVIESVRSSDDRVAYVVTQAETAKESGKAAKEALEMMGVQVQKREDRGV